MLKQAIDRLGGKDRGVALVCHASNLRKRRGPKVLCSSILLLLALCGGAASAQSQNRVVTSPVKPEQSVSESQKRVIFDRGPFYDHPYPYWSEGYLISRETETPSPDRPNVVLFGRDGSKSAEVAFWFPGSQRVVVTSAALSHRGDGVLASGEADKADGTRAYYIARANLTGQITNVIQTGDFYPRNVCEAPDGSVWAFGGIRWERSRPEPPVGNLLRRFDFQHGEIASYIPRSTFPRKVQADAVAFIRCTGDAVLVYSSPAHVFIRLTYKSQTPRIYEISNPGLESLDVVTVAVTDSGAIYGGLSDFGPDTGNAGIYYLVLDQTSQSGHWQPVEGGVGHWDEKNVVSGVYGADGESLVVSRIGDPAGRAALHWVTLSPK